MKARTPSAPDGNSADPRAEDFAREAARRQKEGRPVAEDAAARRDPRGLGEEDRAPGSTFSSALSALALTGGMSPEEREEGTEGEAGPPGQPEEKQPDP